MQVRRRPIRVGPDAVLDGVLTCYFLVPEMWKRLTTAKFKTIQWLPRANKAAA